MLTQTFKSFDKDKNSVWLTFVYNQTGEVVESFLNDFDYSKTKQKYANAGSLPTIFISKTEFNSLQKMKGQ